MIMGLAHGVRRELMSRREALTLLGAAAIMRSAGAAEAGLLQPVSLDHVNIRVANVTKTAAFYMGLFDTPVLRNPALRAQPTSPPSEGFFLKFGDGYLAISQAFAPNVPDLDHYSIGLRDYDGAKVAAKLRDNGMKADPRAVDVWATDPDGSLIQLRSPGGWARQNAAPYQAPTRVGPALSPLSMSRIALRSKDFARAGDYYARLFGAEITPAASSRSRAFSLGDSVLELNSVPANSASTLGMDYIRIAIKDFNAETVGSVLRARGIDAGSAGGAVRISDPDGMRIELATPS
jgi:catechol 2,3-dioxygenase-like lactoylglutathione lyase family enzyme/predicted enzyme related to lactoylglutathione lyase